MKNKTRIDEQSHYVYYQQLVTKTNKWILT